MDNFRFEYYQTKPVLKRVFRWNGNNLPQELLTNNKVFIRITNFTKQLELHIHQGYQIAEIGDWVIEGSDGEFYSCKDDVFKKAYRKVDNEKQ